MQNKTPILVITGLAIVALAGVAGLTRDRWMGHSPEVVAIAPEPPKPAEPPAAPAAPAEAPAEQPAATAEQTPSPPPAPAVAQNQTPAPAAEATPPAAPAPAATETQPAQQAVATPPEQPAATNAAETAKVPSFDTVRVEKTGEAVIAGTAPAGSDVVVKLDGKAIGETTANSEGAFVVVPEQPLPAGSGALTIEAKGKSDAQATQSKQSVAVIVPAADQPQEALVAVVSPDQPTRVLQKPAAPEAVAPASTTETANTETKGDAAIAPAPAPAQPATAEKPAKMVSIDAVDYDPTGNIVFSGQGEAGNTARLYIDNNNLGDAAVGADGRWTYSGTADVAPGVHSLRVDGLDSAGKVLNRVEVPFFREQQSKVAQIVPKAAEPAETAPAAAPDVVAPKAADATAPAAPAAPVPAAPVPAAPAQAAPVAAAPAPAAPVAAAPAETPDTASDGSAAAPAAPAAADEPATADEPGMAPSAPAQPPAAPVATAEPPEGRIVIQPGNNLWRISRVLYGTGARFTTLYEANKDQIRNPNLIYPGQVFKTPDVSAEGGTVDPKRREPLNAGTGQ